jgi:malate dehydrogenase (oxaloacetate-decarboxylating)
MLVSVARAIASIVEDIHLRNDYIIPKVDDPRILPIVTKTIKRMLRKHIKKTILSGHIEN